MTRDTVRARQANSDDNTASLIRVTVAAVGDTTVTVQLPGGSTLTAPRIGGCTYTAGDVGFAVWQEPAAVVIGAAGTRDGTSGIGVANGAVIQTSRTALSRSDRDATLNAGITLNSGLQIGNAVLTIPDKYRPKVQAFFTGSLYYNGGFTGTVNGSVRTNGDVVIESASGSSGNGAQVFFSIPWVTP